MYDCVLLAIVSALYILFGMVPLIHPAAMDHEHVVP